MICWHQLIRYLPWGCLNNIPPVLINSATAPAHFHPGSFSSFNCSSTKMSGKKWQKSLNQSISWNNQSVGEVPATTNHLLHHPVHHCSLPKGTPYSNVPINKPNLIKNSSSVNNPIFWWFVFLTLNVSTPLLSLWTLSCQSEKEIWRNNQPITTDIA